MIKVDIFSESDFVLQIESQQFELCKKNYLSTTINSNSSILIKCFPLGSNKISLPFIVKLFEKNGEVVSFCDNVKIYKFNSYTEVHISEIIVETLSSCFLKKITLENSEQILVRVNTNSVVFETPEFSKLVKVKFLTCDVISIKNFTLAYGKSQTNHLIVFNPQDSSCQVYEYEQLEFGENSVKILETCNNSVNIKRLVTLTFGESVTMSIELFYANSLTSSVPNEKILPIMFFDYLKLGNVSSAKKMLDDSISNNISDQALLGFFGEFNKVFLKSTNPIVCNVYYFDHAKAYTFDIENNKICDISES